VTTEDELKRFYNVEDIAEHLQVNPQTVRISIRQGVLKGSKIGRRWMVHHQNLRAFIMEKFDLDEPEDDPPPDSGLGVTPQA
jgi:Mn-dependent DtxR family transcriptional regulator